MVTTVLTRTITHICLRDANRSKLAVLDQLVYVYLPLCQSYVHYFCTTGAADAFAAPRFETQMSERWQRVAIQQAAGIAQSWLTNRQQHHADYLQRKVAFDAYELVARGARLKYNQR
jgi:hypothetical protein